MKKSPDDIFKSKRIGYKLSTLLVFVLLFIFCGNSSAEIITLRSGKVIDGEIIEASEREMTLKEWDADNEIKVKYKLIEKIEGSLSQDTSNEYFDIVVEKIDEINKIKQERNAALLNKIQSKEVEFYMTSWCPYCTKMDKFSRLIFFLICLRIASLPDSAA